MKTTQEEMPVAEEDSGGGAEVKNETLPSLSNSQQTTTTSTMVSEDSEREGELRSRGIPKESPTAKESYERGFVPLNLSMKEIREVIPPHCFERNVLRSFSYVARDLTMAAGLFFLASKIGYLPQWLQFVAWPLYWVSQGVVCTGIWVLAHECGHQAFSNSRRLNNFVGFVLHSALLVPYHSWRISHSNHHRATGHMTRDQVFVPKTRSRRGLPPKDEDPNPDGPHPEFFEEAPLVQLYHIVSMLIFGWPMYLFVNSTGQQYGRWASHFNPTAPLFEESQRMDVVLSDVGVLTTLGTLSYAARAYGLAAVVKYYVVPYILVNCWLVLITYLQHTDERLPHYRGDAFNFQRGATSTVDRSYGKVLDFCHHHITDTHVAHHFFSQMPHYHAVEATKHLKKLLGKFYVYDNTPIPIALWRSYRECRFVEDTGDVVFYKK